MWNKLEDCSFGEKTNECLSKENGEVLKEHMLRREQKSSDKLSVHMKSNVTNEVYQNIGKILRPSLAAAASFSPKNTF